MPIDFGNLYAENLGWGMAYTVMELSLALPLTWIATRHMCGHHTTECDAWTGSERGWAVGLLAGYVGVKVLAAIHAGSAARAYNRAQSDRSAVLYLFPTTEGGGIGLRRTFR